MGLRIGGKCAMWSIEDKGSYASANLSTSKRKKDSKEYETDWRNGYVWLCDRAYENLKGYAPLGEGEYMEIRIGKGYEKTNDQGQTYFQTPIEITSNYVKEKNREYTNYKIYDAEPIVSDKTKAEAKQESVSIDSIMEIPDSLEDALPFK